MTLDRIDEIRARVEAARSSLWDISGGELERPAISVALFNDMSPSCSRELRKLISLANQDIPYLLAELDRMAAEKRERGISQPVTNADMIRGMRDEELAVTLMCPNEMGMADIDCDHGDDRNCCQCLLDWLREEVPSCQTPTPSTPTASTCTPSPGGQAIGPSA